MRRKASVNVEIARNILCNARGDLEDLDKWWPKSKRGSNAERVLKSIKERISAVELCLVDAAADLGDE
jgi:hypothetical protein